MQENKMDVMPIGKLIITMSWPAVISMLIQAIYNIVDSYFVSKVGEEALAAVTYIFPIQMVMVACAIGSGVGINSLLSRRLGAKRMEEANLVASHGYRVAFFGWAVFAAVGILVPEPIMSIMTDTPFIIEEGAKYLSIIMIGSLFMFVQLISEKILQATGNMVFPMLCSLTGAVTNVIFDPLLIFGIGPFPVMGLSGAAIATVFGQMISMILGQYLLFGKKHPVTVRLRGYHWDWGILKEIYAVGFPAILTQCIGSVNQFGMNMILGAYTETAIAIMGIFGRLQSFIFMPVFGLNQGLLPILGYSYGARNRKRMMDAYKKGFILAFIIMCFGLIAFQLVPYQLIHVFNDAGSQNMYDVGVPAMRAMSLAFVPASFGIVTSALFQASGHGFLSLWSSLIRQLIGVLPLAYILGKVFGMDMIWYSIPLAEILGTSYLIIAFTILYKRELKHL